MIQGIRKQHNEHIIYSTRKSGMHINYYKVLVVVSTHRLSRKLNCQNLLCLCDSEFQLTGQNASLLRSEVNWNTNIATSFYLELCVADGKRTFCNFRSHLKYM